MEAYTTLKKRIEAKKAVIGVVGLGYVGLPMAIRFACKGFKVKGVDTSEKRVKRLRKGISYIGDITDKQVLNAVKEHGFTVTADFSVLGHCDAVIICVPTPINKSMKPDISFMVSVTRSLKAHLKAGQLIVLESTTYPGTTRDVILPILGKTGLKEGVDFFLAFSPERIDPGNPEYNFSNIPKLVGGITERCTTLARDLYSKVTERVIGLSSSETAEVTKLLENSFRIVNIGLINEFAHLCHKLGIDVWEVIKAASTKPFGFMPFHPGPGVGGHCIPADPMYLSWKARKVGFETRMIDLAAKVNLNAPRHIWERVARILKDNGKKMKESKILVLGVAYKKDVNDLRESPALEVLKYLERTKTRWLYHDPYIPYLEIHGLKSKNRKLSASLIRGSDMVLILTDHSKVDYGLVYDNAKSIFDTRNVMAREGFSGKKIIKL